MEFQPKNSTTARKPGNDMKKSGLPKMGQNPAMNQRDSGLGFDGLDVTEQRASSNRFAHNQHAGFKNPDMIQMSQMPVRKGYAVSNGAKRTAPATAAGASRGHREWKPASGQNFKGNPDRIQERQLYNRVGNKD